MKRLKSNAAGRSVWLLALIPSLVFPGTLCKSQQGSPLPSTVAESKPLNGDDDRYRIGPSDVISIQVFGKPQLSRDEQVDARGSIKMPLLDEDIRAACRTEDELAAEIARLYREHELLRNPTVYVSVKDYQSQPVAVLGSVNAPGRFILHRSIRLRELLVFFAGGPTAKAGRKVQILSTGTALSCESTTALEKIDPASQTAEHVTDYDLQELLSSQETVNPVIRRGDIVNVPASEEAFIVGNVARPSSISIVEPTTIRRALAMVGGTLPDTKKDKIRVLRQIPGGITTTEILIDLASADQTKGVDFLLRGGDIVEVDTKTGFQKVLKDLTRTMVPSFTSMPYRIIP